MRKISAIVLALILSLGCFIVVSFAAEKSDMFVFEVKGEAATLTDCNEKAKGKITVPETALIDGKEYPVKHIGEKAFSKCNEITEIVLPEGVTTIGFHAFYECIALKDVYIPSTLLTCQYDAFDKCNTVTIHCYKCNYQFFNVYGYGNLILDVVDADDEEENDTSDDEVFEVDTFVETILRFISDILAVFGIEWDWVEFVKTLIN